MQIDVLGELKTHGEVRSAHCIRCLKCTDECPKGAIALSLRRSKASLSTDTAVRAEWASLKRRKLSAFDVAITVLWVSATLGFAFSGIRQDAPQEIKSL